MNRRSWVAIGGIAVVLVAAGMLLQSSSGAQESTGLADGSHPVGACSVPYHLSGAGWDLCWQLDEARAQGLEINQAYFQNRSVVWKMGVPFSLTQYEGSAVGPWKDTLGRPNGGGHPGFGRGAMELDASDCPRFYGEGSLIRENTVCVEQRGGPEEALGIWARFDIFNYRFIQGYQFDSRGHIQPMVLMGGELIDGDLGSNSRNHLHHPYWRIDLDIGSDGNDTAQAFAHAPSTKHPGLPVQVHSPIPPPATPESSIDAEACRTERVTPTGWCNVSFEGKVTYAHEGYGRWRVQDTADVNARNHPRSYEVFQNSEGAADQFSSTDAMVLQYKGDSSEIGYEVPTRPTHGDRYMDSYMIPSEPVEDPVVWLASHVYHETRDEDRGSMSYHYVSPELRPHNFVAENPGETTFP